MLRAGDIIEAARFKHPQFVRNIIPTSVAANMVNEAVYQMLLATHEVNPSYLVRTWTITLRPEDDRASVGAGSTTGAPLIEGTTSLERSPTATGFLAEDADDLAVLQAESAATSASGVTLTDATRSWTVNAYAGQRVRITAGLGVGQVREIASNTADTVTVVDAWDVTPDDTSMYVIEGNDYEVDGHLGVVQGSVPVRGPAENAWLVRYDAQGQPYLDLANPIEVQTTQGIPLPPHYFINHGKVFVGTGNGQTVEQGTFLIIDPSNAQSPPKSYCGYIEGERLFLCGDGFRQRSRVQTIEVPYLPMNIPVTAAGDVLVLPDAAREALVGAVAVLMLERARILGVAGTAGGKIEESAAASSALYLRLVGKQGRATGGRIREVW